MPKPLDLENVRSRLEYVAETGDLCWKKSKRGMRAGTMAATVLNQKGYRRIRIDGSTYQQHRVIWFLLKGEWPKNELDHINRCRHDNRIENLREATISQQRGNSKLNSRNKLGVRGVCFYNGRYQAEIRNKRIGRFKTLEEARSAYERAAHAYYGPFYAEVL